MTAATSDVVCRSLDNDRTLASPTRCTCPRAALKLCTPGRPGDLAAGAPSLGHESLGKGSPPIPDQRVRDSVPPPDLNGCPKVSGRKRGPGVTGARSVGGNNCRAAPGPRTKDRTLPVAGVASRQPGRWPATVRAETGWPDASGDLQHFQLAACDRRPSTAGARETRSPELQRPHARACSRFPARAGRSAARTA